MLLESWGSKVDVPRSGHTITEGKGKDTAPEITNAEEFASAVVIR